MTLDSAERDAVLAVGMMPVGVAAGVNDPDSIDDVPRVGSIEGPNLEAILALDPDLILSNANRSETLDGQLSAIAPTVMGVQTGVPWKAELPTLHGGTGCGGSSGCRRRPL
ncbi:ABC transporter substrate-binding protein [Rhodococcus baikonurensis]|uniref:ABC transporter substrate-binding protein n=1 Tax=Rhodococcus erythropolis group TaxID=2840174 RepID=UPI00155698E9